MVAITAGFDEFNLDVNVGCQGRPMRFPTQRPTHEDIVNDDNAPADPSGYLARQCVDRISPARRGQANDISLHLKH